MTWRKSKQIKKPLREINLATISSSSYVIAEEMSAEIFLEHCKASTQQTNFFESFTVDAKDQLPLDTNANKDDPSILFTTCYDTDFDYSSIPCAVDPLNELPSIDLSSDSTDVSNEIIWNSQNCNSQDDAQEKNPQEVQFFDIPAEVPVLSTEAQQSDGHFLGYCLYSGAAKSVLEKHQNEQLCRCLKHRLSLKNQVQLSSLEKARSKVLAY